MTPEQKAQLIAQRQQKLGGLVSTPPVPVITLSEVAEEVVAVLPEVNSGLVSHNEDFTTYNVKLSTYNVEFIKQYAYTRSCILRRNVTIAEAIDDAVASLRQHTTFELKPLPEWKKTNKRQWNKRK